MSTKKSVLLWHWGRRGGGPKYTYELCRSIKQKETLELSISISQQCEIFDDFAALDIPMHVVDTYDNVWSAAFSTLQLPKISHDFWKFVRARNVECIVTGMPHLWDVPILLQKPSNLPYITVAHDAAPHPGEVKFLRQFLMKSQYKQSDFIVTLSQHVQKLIEQQYNIPISRTCVIPHGVFPYADATKTKKEKDTFRILFFGRILAYKGLDILLEAYKLLKQRHQNVELVIAGPGNITPYQDIIDQLKDLTIDNRWIPEEEIGSILQSCDISVSPYKEASQSGVIATAYSAGLPVVATPVGGLVEQIRHENTGLICQDVTPQSLCNSLERLITDRALFDHCRQGAHEEIETKLSWSAIAGDFIRVINEEISRKNTGAKGLEVYSALLHKL